MVMSCNWLIVNPWTAGSWELLLASTFAFTVPVFALICVLVALTVKLKGRSKSSFEREHPELVEAVQGLEKNPGLMADSWEAFC